MKQLGWILAGILGCSGVSAAAIDASKSEVVATFKQMGVPVEGRFSRVQGDISLDPAKPEQASAELEVEMASFDLGSEEYNAEVAKADWFNQPKFPKALFRSKTVKATGAGKLELSGDLSIKGQTQPITLPVRYQAVGSGYQFDGELPIHRLQFRIGEGEWQQTDLVADEVKVRFKLVTAK